MISLRPRPILAGSEDTWSGVLMEAGSRRGDCWEGTVRCHSISFGIFSAILASWAWAGLIHPAAAQDAMTGPVTMTVGFGAGERPDLYGRILGRSLVRSLPGQPALLVLNKPGAGGVIALNEWVNKAEPNGLHVTIGASSQIDRDALARTKAKYDPTKFKYVGGLAAPSQALFASKDAVERLSSKSAKPVAIGVVGATLRTGHYQALWGAAFLGWNIQWVQGYRMTGELRQALERGEIDMAPFGSSTDIDYLLATGKFAVVSQSGTIIDGKMVSRPVLGNAPVISDLVKARIKEPLAQKAFEYGENIIQVGMWLALPPETPDGIVATYVKAFEVALNDPQFQAAWVRIDPDSPVASKADLERLAHELDNAPPEAVEYIQAELKRQGFGVGSR
jgi:tripartite-type tricarboxylate transporter receptor subunit TctC